MKWRIASFAVLIGIVSTGVAWLALQPPVLAALRALQLSSPESGERLVIERMLALLPYSFAAALLAAIVLTWGLLLLAVERPLRAIEALLSRVGEEPSLFEDASRAPLLSRFQTTLSRTFRALAEERERTHRQLEELQARNAELARARTELAAAERLATVGRLSAGIAHEVGNPLSGILGYISLVQSRAERPEEVRTLVGHIGEEVRRIDGIVRGLLDLGRPSSGELQPVSVAEVVDRCVRLISGSPELTSIDVAQEVEPGLVARAQPGPLAQVLINLLLNAAQAMEGQGVIKIRGWSETAEGSASVHLAVEDSGPGLPAGNVFEPFFTTKGGQGSGLGLAVSLHLSTAMNGRLTAVNAPSGGARFELILPAA